MTDRPERDTALDTVAATVYVGLGANVGDPLAQLRHAVVEMTNRLLLRGVIRKSSLYQTPPWGDKPDQPPFINAVVCGATLHAPDVLLAELKAVELDMGRCEDAERGAPRPIDLDILLYGDEVVQTPELTIPHPRMRERAFVLVPLLEIAPDLTDPATGRPYRLDLERMADDVRAVQSIPETF
jgi:2-amino-4-hydroxy-6-hydroxymethyldihydropteridine diphosphokinase